MMEQKMKELAAMYGIEIKDVEMGNGGLFYEDSNGNKEALNDIFEPDGYSTPKYANVKLKECNQYCEYSVTAGFMLSVA